MIVVQRLGTRCFMILISLACKIGHHHILPEHSIQTLSPRVSLTFLKTIRAIRAFNNLGSSSFLDNSVVSGIPLAPDLSAVFGFLFVPSQRLILCSQTSKLYTVHLSKDRQQDFNYT